MIDFESYFQLLFLNYKFIKDINSDFLENQPNIDAVREYYINILYWGKLSIIDIKLFYYMANMPCKTDLHIRYTYTFRIKVFTYKKQYLF